MESQGKSHSSCLEESEVLKIRAYFQQIAEATTHIQNTGVANNGSKASHTASNDRAQIRTPEVVKVFLEPGNLNVAKDRGNTPQKAESAGDRQEGGSPISSSLASRTIDLSKIVMPSSKRVKQYFVETGPLLRIKQVRAKKVAVVSSPPPVIDFRSPTGRFRTSESVVSQASKSSPRASSIDTTSSAQRSSLSTLPIPSKLIRGTSKAKLVTKDQRTLLAPVVLLPDSPKKFFCFLCKHHFNEFDIEKHLKFHSGNTTQPYISEPRPLQGGGTMTFILSRMSEVNPKEQREDVKPLPCNVFGEPIYPGHREQSHIVRPIINLKDQQKNRSTAYYLFPILPPGERDINRVIQEYRRRTRSGANGPFDRVIDQSRQNQIQLLNPEPIRMGTKGWKGYVVCLFKYSSRVMLESIIINNATYILSGSWEEMIDLTKAEIRSEYEGQYDRIFHTDNWLSNVQKALRMS